MDIEFQKRLLATFKVETREHLTAISSGLIALEKAADGEKRQEILEAVFREAHSLKGAARAVNMARIESLSHAMESVFAGFRNQKSTPPAALFDLLHRTIDTIDKNLSSIDTGRDDSEESRTRELVLSLERAAAGSAAAPPPPPRQTEYKEAFSPETPVVSDTVRIPAGKLDSVLNRAEEMLSAKLAALQRAAEVGEISSILVSLEKEWKKAQPALRRLRKARQALPGRPFSDADAGQLGKLLEFLESGHAAIKSVAIKVRDLSKAAAADRHSLESMVDALVDDLKEVLMLPCATILAVLPKMVRDLSRDRGKDTELVVTGDTVEIDKRVLEELKDPIIHLVRNCIDHGIEMPDERRRRNKPVCGRISVQVSLRDSNRIEILVTDDGAGIDTVRVAGTAVQRGIIAQDDAKRMESEELMALVFRSGFSTSPLITDISGRGLGLAIVREKVEKLGGTVTVVSEPLKGTTFRMVLPMTLSTYRGVLVKVGDQTLVVPAASVERVLRIDKASVKTVENRETVELDGKAVSLVRLADILQLQRKERSGDDDGLIPLFVIGSGVNRIAFGVDSVLGEREVLVKNLGKQLSRVRNVAGATVLGTGKVVTILHPGDLVKSAVKGAALPVGAVSPVQEGEAVRKSVLIAEDSITARTLLRNILETAGYEVRTAVDGIDALTQLRTEQVDLVVSDVDMPRMNGFDLTAKIRAAREFADLPVVLVTSLDSREDRERGIEVGANAYIVKSSFDQGNLLQVIRRLI